jgi:3-dehydroquinate dehydratase type I
MNSKICVSLGGNTPFGTCLQQASMYPFVETRLDLMKIDYEKIDLLAMQCRQWIATCRPGKLTERERTVLLSAAIRAGATYVDIEYEAETKYRLPLLELAKQKNCKIIISYHNFEETPGDYVLNEIITRSKSKFGADCVKIAVMANSSIDCCRVLSLYGRHRNIVAFAMGDAGKITRVAAPFLSADFTFASFDEAQQTAPGQLTVSQMEEIFRILG